LVKTRIAENEQKEAAPRGHFPNELVASIAY
jgi:hypothetical protein